MSLHDEVKTLTGVRRKFILLRIAHLDPEAARKLVGVKKGTYNNWCKEEAFVTIHRKINDFGQEYKQEAVKLLRRDNQLEAVLLETEIIQHIKEEIKTGNYDLIRTNLARVVYDKLISDLDFQPKKLSLTWYERLNQMGTQQPGEIEEAPYRLAEGDNGEVSEAISQQQD